jgi:hypothetical protein
MKRETTLVSVNVKKFVEMGDIDASLARRIIDEWPMYSRQPYPKGLCRDARHGWECTRRKGHTGPHVGHFDENVFCAAWPQRKAKQ